MAAVTTEGIAAEAAAVAAEALARAALVHRFDPLELISSTAGLEVEARALALVARDATETEWSDPKSPERPVTLWRLTPEARRRELGKLHDAGELESALKEATASEGDLFAKHLRAALRGETNPASVPSGERESAAAAAHFAAEVMGASQAEKMRAVVRELRTALSEAAEEEHASLGLCGKLVGRRKERGALEAFAATGAIAETARLPVVETRAIEVPALFLFGPSGVGKSALVADLVRRWRGYWIEAPIPDSWTDMRGVARWTMSSVESFAGLAMSAMRRVMDRALGRTGRGRIVVLDLSRLALAIGGEVEWTAEVSRQIGLGRPAVVKRLRALRNDVRANRIELDPSGKSVTALRAASADLKQGLAEVLPAELTGLPLVVVLDDFEEAVLRSFPVEDERLAETLFGRVLHWADSLETLAAPSGAPLFGTVRVIVAASERPVLDDEDLARWFEARLELRSQSEAGVPATPETLPSDERFSAPEASVLARYREAGPLRMRADEVAGLARGDLDAAVLSRLEFARQEGRALAASEWRLASQSGAAPAEAAADARTSPDRLFAVLREREIAARIDYAFTFADFDAATAIGWRRIGTISDFPDLSEPWRLPGDPVVHWIWQTALAALAIEDSSAARPRLLDFLKRFADRLDPARARADATGLVLAAAATIALDGRLPPELAAATSALADKAASLSSVRNFADLRLLALHPLWLADHEPERKTVQIPYRRLRLFSTSLLAEPHPSLELEGTARLAAFVADARIQAPTAREIDAFAASDGKRLELGLAPAEDQYGRLADILVGVSPELYDTIVVALEDVGKTASAAIDLAIGEIRARAPFWPSDVVPETVPTRDHDRRSGLVVRAVLHADRCGLLASLLDAVRRQVDSRRLRDVTRLVQRYEALRRRAFARSQAGPSNDTVSGADERGT